MWPFSNTKHQGRELVANGALLLDVRTPDEFREHHIDGATNIPVQELGSRMGELGPKDRPIVVYCRSGARSATATSMMKSAGYQVLDIGGIASW
jgi:phage shock protein E